MSAVLISLINSFSVLAKNGGYPHNKIYNIIPHDQTSHFSL